MSAIAVPPKWVSALDEKKFGRVARYALHYRIGSAPYDELPLGGAVSMGKDGLSAPTLSPNPLTVREFLESVYRLGFDHFLSDTGADGSHPKAADLKIILLDDRDHVLGEASKKLSRGEAARLTDDAGVLEQVTEGANVLAQTCRALSTHIVTITGVEQRSRNDYESIMCNQMRAMGEGWQELIKDREKIQIDLCEATAAKVRAEEESKRLELERQLAEEKTFLDTPIGEKLGSILITGLAPKIVSFIDSALATASCGLERRRLKANAELLQYKRELEADLAAAKGDRCGDPPGDPPAR